MKHDFEDLSIVQNDDGSIRFKHEGGYVNVKVNAKADFPYISLCNEDKDQKFISCMYLFIGEVVTFLKYIFKK